MNDDEETYDYSIFESKLCGNTWKCSDGTTIYIDNDYITFNTNGENDTYSIDDVTENVNWVYIKIYKSENGTSYNGESYSFVSSVYILKIKIGTNWIYFQSNGQTAYKT
jgi:glucan-binding YG repeat protein